MQDCERHGVGCQILPRRRSAVCGRRIRCVDASRGDARLCPRWEHTPRFPDSTVCKSGFWGHFTSGRSDRRHVQLHPRKRSAPTPMSRHHSGAPVAGCTLTGYARSDQRPARAPSCVCWGRTRVPRTCRNASKGPHAWRARLAPIPPLSQLPRSTSHHGGEPMADSYMILTRRSSSAPTPWA